MKRNFGVGSPVKQEDNKIDELGRKTYRGGSIYDYYENPTQENIDDMLSYAEWLGTGNKHYAKKAENIKKHAAADLRTMELDKIAKEETLAEKRRLQASGELGPQG